jgi:hypothetical protein
MTIDAGVISVAITVGANHAHSFTFEEILRVVGDFEKRFNQLSPA